MPRHCLDQTGYAANYAQGMDFDNDDGTLYIFLYVGGGANVYGTVNLVTGAVTPLATSNPQGEFEGAIRTTGFTDIPWLSETPTSGTINPGDCTPVDVTFDSTGLTLGDYFAGLQFDSNDPDRPVDVPITLHVVDAQIVVDPTSLELTLLANTTGSLLLTISNEDGGLLTWDLSGSLPTDWLWEEPSSGTIPSGGYITVEVTFDSTGLTPGEYLASLDLASNDPDEPLIHIQVTMTVRSNNIYLPIIVK